MKTENITLFQQTVQDIINFGNNILFKKEKNENKIKIVIAAELMELLDCYNWKPWSRRNINKIIKLNRKVEMIDTFIATIYYYSYKNKLNEQKIKDFIEYFNICKKKRTDNDSEKDELKTIEKTILNINTPNISLIKNVLNIMSYRIKSIKEICYLTETKIILSSFRNEKGYKDGHYVKKWNDLEDNHYIYLNILPSLLNKTKDINQFKKELRSNLESIYATINKTKFI